MSVFRRLFFLDPRVTPSVLVNRISSASDMQGGSEEARGVQVRQGGQMFIATPRLQI